MDMKRRVSISPVLLLTFFSLGFIYSGYSQSSLFSFEKITNGKGDTLKYRQLFPDYDTVSETSNLRQQKMWSVCFGISWSI